jgi:hypothetical protein
VEQDEKDHRHYLTTQLPEALTVLSKDLLEQTEKLEELDDKLIGRTARDFWTCAAPMP